MALEHRTPRPRLDVPHTHRHVVRSAHHEHTPAHRARCYAPHAIRVALEHSALRHRLDIPHAQRLVSRGAHRKHAPAHRARCDAIHGGHFTLLLRPVYNDLFWCRLVLIFFFFDLIVVVFHFSLIHGFYLAYDAASSLALLLLLVVVVVILILIARRKTNVSEHLVKSLLDGLLLVSQVSEGLDAHVRLELLTPFILELARKSHRSLGLASLMLARGRRVAKG